MRKLYLLFLIMLPLAFMQAQVADVSATDCSDRSKSIHSVLGTGKVLLVVSEGLDCSICQNKALALQSWASQNPGIEVWGAMNFIYSSSVPACPDIHNWTGMYNWTNIFTFANRNRDWLFAGTPQYYVYNPEDSSLAYQGFSESAAQNTALSLENALGIDKKTAGRFFIGQGEGFLVLNNLSAENGSYQLFDLTGRQVKSDRFSTASAPKVYTVGLNSGIYLLKVKGNNGFEAVRKVILK